LFVYIFLLLLISLPKDVIGAEEEDDEENVEASGFRLEV
jgi:hypothetical protein